MYREAQGTEAGLWNSIKFNKFERSGSFVVALTLSGTTSDYRVHEQRASHLQHQSMKGIFLRLMD